VWIEPLDKLTSRQVVRLLESVEVHRKIHPSLFEALMVLVRVSKMCLGPLLFVLAAGLVGGGCQSGPGPGTRHPQPDRVPHYYDPDHKIRGRTVAKSSLACQLRTALSSPTQMIGTQGGGGPEMFGEIGDVVLDGRGRVVVFDGENREVRLFGAEGTFVTSFGRTGEGPGEFASTAQLAVLGDGSLAVMERANRAQLFEPSGKTYERVGGFTVNLAVEDLCVLGDTLFVHDLRWEEPTKSIFAYTPSGERVGAMGPVYHVKNKLLKGQVTEGRLACDRATGTIVYAFERAPILYGYAPEGTLRWTARLQPFTSDQVELVTGEDGTPAVQYPSTPSSDRISSLVDAPGPGVLVQRFRTPPEGEAPVNASVHTYWVSARDGSGSYVAGMPLRDSSVAIIRSVTESYLVATRPVPFPRVHIHSVHSVNWQGARASGQ